MAYGYGKALEKQIEMANNQYLERKIGDIQKVETPVMLDRRTGQGKPTKKSIVDFIGFYIKDGKFMPVAFDAKETRDERAFPLSSIKEHQFEYLKIRHDFGTEAFLIIYAVHHDVCFRLDFPLLAKWWKAKKRKEPMEGCKTYASIPFPWLAKHCPQLFSSRGIILDYLMVENGGKIDKA